MSQPQHQLPPPAEIGSVTQWIEEVRERGDGKAQHEIYQRYSSRLAGLARVKLRSSRKREFDEEDVVSESLLRFFEALEAGKCAEMSNRDDLWNYLVRIAENKAIDLMRREGRAKRGGGKVVGEQTAFPAAAGDSQSPGLDQLPELGEPSSEMVDELAGCCYDWFRRLDDEERQIVHLKGQGYSNKEIANRIDRVERSVERKLKAIRSKLADSGDIE